MSDNSIAEISEILDTFNLDEITTIIEDQVFNEDIDLTGSGVVDQFTPIQRYYQGIINENENDEILKETQTRFINICIVFLKAIEKKYAIAVDDQWIQSNFVDLPNVTAALYGFFVVNHASNVEEALYGYIVSHINDLYNVFEGQKAKKDAATLNNKKSFSVEYAVILANLYDVCAYIYDNCFTYADDFFKCMNQDYIYLGVIRDMYEKGQITGISEENPDTGCDHEVDFTDRLGEIFKRNVTYKGIICYNIGDRLRKHATLLDVEETADNIIDEK